jgi:DNA polymerase V
MLEKYRTSRDIICIDLKSFYASVECAKRGLDPFNTPLIVADESRGGGSIVLAVSPYLKAKGIPGRLRLFELPENIPGLIIAKPRMRTYLEYSAEIIRIYLNYVAPEDLHIYSVDEVFLDITPYQSFYQKPARAIAEMILKDIWQQTQIPATAGIGDTLLLAKVALDIESKKVPGGIAEWRFQDVPEKLWPIQPLSKFWGIGGRME